MQDFGLRLHCLVVFTSYVLMTCFIKSNSQGNSWMIYINENKINYSASQMQFAVLHSSCIPHFLYSLESFLTTYGKFIIFFDKVNFIITNNINTMLFFVITLVMSYHDYCCANLCHCRDSSGGSSGCGW